MALEGTPGENRNGLNPIEAVTKASYAVGLTRLSAPEGSQCRAKSTWNLDYTSIDFFELILVGVYRIEIQEELDSYFRTGKIFISDRQTLLSLLPLTGNELITVRYTNSLVTETGNTSGLAPKIIHFSIASIENATNTLEGIEKGSRIFKLNLVEAPAFSVFTNKAIYKTFNIDAGNNNPIEKPKRQSKYKDLMIASLVGESGSKKQIPQSIIEKWYDVDVENNIEDTKCADEHKVDFYIPNWTISKTLNYIKSFAVSKDNYPFYVFFIRSPEKEGLKPKIYLKTIYSLFEQKQYHAFYQNFASSAFRPSVNDSEKYQDYEEEQEPFDPLNVYFDIKINYFNIIQTAFSGLSGETFATFDYIGGNNYIAFDYSTFVENHKGLGDASMHAFDYGNQWSSLRTHSYTEKERLINKKRNEFAKRQLQSALSCAMHCTLNHSRHVGEMVDIPIRAALPDSFEDRTFSGRWLIWGQKDVMVMDKAYSICHLVKEGFSQETNNTIRYDKILNKFSENLNIREVEDKKSI